MFVLPSDMRKPDITSPTKHLKQQECGCVGVCVVCARARAVCVRVRVCGCVFAQVSGGTDD